jgi:hypothetical protein
VYLTQKTIAQLLTSLDLPKKYYTHNPFKWMEMISLEGKTNFFEKGVSEYSKAGISTDTVTNKAGREFDLNEAFWRDRERRTEQEKKEEKKQVNKTNTKKDQLL